jgi:hypothetical protein
MNRGARGRRLASPVRLALAIELGGPLGGAWWPRTASIPRELPELVDALFARLGEIVSISVNWSSMEGAPDLDALNLARKVDSGRVVGHQRLMAVTGSRASTNLLVVPCRTSAALAIMVLRQAAALPITPIERNTREFQTGHEVVGAARVESALCGHRLGNSGLVPLATAGPVMTD